MSALRWAAIPVIAGVLTANVAPAAATEPPPTPAPTATPDPTPDPTAPAEPGAAAQPEAPAAPEPAPSAPMYVTTITTTTTTVNAPIIVVAAPITTTLNTSTTAPAGTPLRERVVINLTGCGRPRPHTPHKPHHPAGSARIRLARNATLVIRVNHRPIATLRLPSTARHRALRLRLTPTGKLSIQRPTGRVLAVQACTPT
jgi:hypothetical protein